MLWKRSAIQNGRHRSFFKPHKSIKVCGDFRVTVNSALEEDQHPLPNPEELFVSLSCGEKFTKLDLSRAYQQILLDDNSREYVTISTHKGLYRPTRLPFGVASASTIFQSKPRASIARRTHGSVSRGRYLMQYWETPST